MDRMEHETEERARGSPAAVARDLAVPALERVGGLIADPGTDPRVLLQAAKLVLWAAGQEEAEDAGGPLTLRFTGGVDGDL